MDMSQYKGMFISEAREHLRVMSDSEVALEQDSGNREHIDTLFRKAHSIKGMAASMGYGSVSDLSHKLEDLMDRVRNGALTFQPDLADLLLEGIDLISAMVDDVEGDATIRDATALIEKVSAYEPGMVTVSASPATARPQEVQSTGESHSRNDNADSHQTVRVKTDLLDHLIGVTGELITTKHRLNDIGSELNHPRLEEALEELSRQLRQLHNEVLKVRMMPLDMITDRFPRVVRDLAKKNGKEVSFLVEGKNIELDRGILEELSDSLVHILRNSVDHGIESPDDRESAGKARSGKIVLSAQREKDQVVITVQDDGRGMDPARLIQAAIEKGLIRPEEGHAMPVRDALMLTCIPGFSTAREVTDVSGRGVGMDAVKSSIKALGGSLAIESSLGEGTRIILKLPLTIAIIQVLLVQCKPLTVGIPVTNIFRTIELERFKITTRGKRKVFYLEEEVVPLLSLNRILNLPPKNLSTGTINAVVTEIKGVKVGLVVDAFLGQQEVFVKPLDRPLKRLKGINAGAILGDGAAVFLLDVPNLL